MHLVTSTGPAVAGASEQTILRRAVLAILRMAGGGWVWPQKPVKKHMRIEETMAIGPKKQLLLVSCDGERFLVGTGSDSVQTIMRVQGDPAASEIAMVGE